MILIECEQGSPEWHQARAGCITASISRCISVSTHSRTKAAGAVTAFGCISKGVSTHSRTKAAGASSETFAP